MQELFSFFSLWSGVNLPFNRFHTWLIKSQACPPTQNHHPPTEPCPVLGVKKDPDMPEFTWQPREQRKPLKGEVARTRCSHWEEKREGGGGGGGGDQWDTRRKGRVGEWVRQWETYLRPNWERTMQNHREILLQGHQALDNSVCRWNVSLPEAPERGDCWDETENIKKRRSNAGFRQHLCLSRWTLCQIRCSRCHYLPSEQIANSESRSIIVLEFSQPTWHVHVIKNLKYYCTNQKIF